MVVKNKNYTFFYMKGFNSDHLKNRISVVFGLGVLPNPAFCVLSMGLMGIAYGSTKII